MILWASVWLRSSLIIYFIYMMSNMYQGPTAAHDIYIYDYIISIHEAHFVKRRQPILNCSFLYEV